MAKTFQLKAENRQRSGSADIKRMRREGFIPAVIYGSKAENENLKVDQRGFERIMQETSTDNVLVDLDLEGGARKALVQQVQHNHLLGKIMHVDFLAVNEKDTISASVPVELMGAPVGVSQGGLLEHVLHAITVVCLPKDLPETVQVDVTELGIGDAAKVQNLQFPDGVSAEMDGNVVVALVAETRTTRSEAAQGGGEEEQKPDGEEAPAAG